MWQTRDGAKAMQGKLLEEAVAPHFCHECGKQLKAGDQIAHTYDMRRMWHRVCFERTLTPIKNWPKSAPHDKEPQLGRR